MPNWLMHKTDVNIEQMAKVLGISPVVAAVMANRGIKSKLAAQSFLRPALSELFDTGNMRDALKAVEILSAAINNKHKIAICGDYDVDGVMSTAIMYKTLKENGADVIYSIPHREIDGYGLNKRIVAELHECGVKLLLTVDNGISAIDEIKYAKELGMQVVIIDHHEPPFELDSDKKTDILPDADAIIDPKRADCEYPFKLMCAAGLAYKFSVLFYEKLGKPLKNSDELLALASVATLCDVVDLVSENRIIAKFGMDILNKHTIVNLGMRKLFEKRGLVNKKIGAYEIGFIIGPCINATGRLDNASSAVELFITSDEDLADELADKLIHLNNERKNITQDAISKAVSAIEKADLKAEPVIVYYEPEIHESVAGIVAGRLKDAFFHPAIVLTDNGNQVKGSARSIEGYNIFESLYRNKELFIKFGGHEMAAGLSLEKQNVELLREALNRQCELSDEDFIRKIRVDRALALEDIDISLIKALQVLLPHGKGNAAPVFGSKNIVADKVELIGENKNTLRFHFKVNSRKYLKAVCFGSLEQFEKDLLAAYSQTEVDILHNSMLRGIRMDALYYLELNEYAGNEYIGMRVFDYRILKNGGI